MTGFIAGILAAVITLRAVGTPATRNAAASARAALAPAAALTLAVMLACAAGYAAAVLAGAVLTAAGTAAVVWLLYRRAVLVPAPARRPAGRWS